MTKQFKFLACALAVALAFVGLTACGNDDDTEYSNYSELILGTWSEVSDYERPNILIFRDSGLFMDNFIGAFTYLIDKNTLYFTEERYDITFDYKILKLTNDCLILKRNESEFVYKKIKANEPSADFRDKRYAERILGTWSETGDLSEKRPDGILNLILGFNEDGSYRFCDSNGKHFYTVQEDLIRMIFSENFDGNYSSPNISYAQILELTDNTLKLRYLDVMGTVSLIRVE